MEFRSVDTLQQAVGLSSRVYSRTVDAALRSDGRVRCHYCHLPIEAGHAVYGCPVDYDPSPGTPDAARFRVRGRLGSLNCLRGYIYEQPAHEIGTLSMNTAIMATAVYGHTLEEVAEANPPPPHYHFEEYGGSLARAQTTCSNRAGQATIANMVDCPEGTIMWKQDQVVPVERGREQWGGEGDEWKEGSGESKGSDGRDGKAREQDLVANGDFARYEEAERQSRAERQSEADRQSEAERQSERKSERKSERQSESRGDVTMVDAGVAAGSGASNSKKKRRAMPTKTRGPLDG